MDINPGQLVPSTKTNQASEHAMGGFLLPSFTMKHGVSLSYSGSIM